MRRNAVSGQFTNGASLLEALERRPLPDILLLDISLPALYEKFGMNNTAALVKVALQQGLVD